MMNNVDFSIAKNELLDDPVLQVIPQMDRILVRMLAYGMSTEEIALVTGCSPEAIEAKLSEIEIAINEFRAFSSCLERSAP